MECIKFRLKSQPKVRHDFLNWFVTSVWLHNTSLSNSENEKKILNQRNSNRHEQSNKKTFWPDGLLLGSWIFIDFAAY